MSRRVRPRSRRRSRVTILLGSRPSPRRRSPAGRRARPAPDRGTPGDQLTAVLAETPCDVALLFPGTRDQRGPCSSRSGGPSTPGRRSSSARGSRTPRCAAPARRPAAVPEHGRRDASRLLSHGALAVQRVLGISAEPLLTPPGEEGMLEASRDAGLLVVGLSTRWHREGLGAARLTTRKRGRPAYAARAPEGSVPAASHRPHPSRASPGRFVPERGLSSCRPARTAARGGTPPTPRGSACGWRASQARRFQDSGSTSQTAPSPLPCVSNSWRPSGETIDHRPAISRP